MLDMNDKADAVMPYCPYTGIGNLCTYKMCAEDINCEIKVRNRRSIREEQEVETQ